MRYRTKAVAASVFAILLTFVAIASVLAFPSPQPPIQGAEKRLTFGAADELDPVYSPDGTRIAYSSNSSGNFDIWIMDAGGKHQARLTSVRGDETHPQFSPDSRKIAYLLASNGRTEVWTMNPDGLDASKVGDHADADSAPQWSPDSRKILFSENGSGHWIVRTYDLKGESTQLTPSESDSRYPAWTPDGSSILFASDLGQRAGYPPSDHDNYSIWIVGTDGTGLRQLTSASGMNVKPVISSDGQHVVYLSNRSGEWGLWETTLNGGEESSLLGALFTAGFTFSSPTAGEDTDIAWRPHDGIIAFTSQQDLKRVAYTLDTASFRTIDPFAPNVLPSLAFAAPGLLFVNMAQLTSDGVCKGISWAPNGNNFVTAINRGASWDIELVRFTKQSLKSGYGP